MCVGQLHVYAYFNLCAHAGCMHTQALLRDPSPERSKQKNRAKKKKKLKKTNNLTCIKTQRLTKTKLNKHI